MEHRFFMSSSAYEKGNLDGSMSIFAQSVVSLFKEARTRIMKSCNRPIGLGTQGQVRISRGCNARLADCHGFCIFVTPQRFRDQSSRGAPRVASILAGAA